MQKHYSKNDDAVSPVIGVMLMLVVTIIIAAVVAAFASGVVDSTSSTPQAVIDSSLKSQDSLILQHKGGDSISGSGIDIIITTKSGLYQDMVYNVKLENATIARTGDKLTKGVIQTGDIVTGFDWEYDIFSVYPNEMTTGTLVEVSVIDVASGKPISKKTVTIQ